MLINRVFRFLLLQIAKLCIIYKVKSSKSLDRLFIEFYLTKYIKKKCIYVGVHNRSFVYTLIYPFKFIDIDSYYLCQALNCSNDNILTVDSSNYQIIIMGGILNYGLSPEKVYDLIKNKKNNNKIILIDHKKDFFELKNLRKDMMVKPKKIKLLRTHAIQEY